MLEEEDGFGNLGGEKLTRMEAATATVSHQNFHRKILWPRVTLSTVVIARYMC